MRVNSFARSYAPDPILKPTCSLPLLRTRPTDRPTIIKQIRIIINIHHQLTNNGFQQRILATTTATNNSYGVGGN